MFNNFSNPQINVNPATQTQIPQVNAQQISMVKQLLSQKGISAETWVRQLCAQRGINVDEFMQQFKDANLP
jgi:hypothetical protein